MITASVDNKFLLVLNILNLFESGADPVGLIEDTYLRSISILVYICNSALLREMLWIRDRSHFGNFFCGGAKNCTKILNLVQKIN